MSRVDDLLDINPTSCLLHPVGTVLLEVDRLIDEAVGLIELLLGIECPLCGNSSEKLVGALLTGCGWKFLNGGSYPRN